MENQKKTPLLRRIISYIQKISKHPFFPILFAGALMIVIYTIGSTGLIRPSFFNFFIGIVLIYYIVALGFMLLLGYTGLASLGTAGFIGLGTYVFGYLFQTVGVSGEVAFLIGIAISIALGTFVGLVSLRIEGMYLAIVTLGLSEILKIFFQVSPLTGSGNGIRLAFSKFLGIETSTATIYYRIDLVIIAVVILMMLWVINIINSPSGRALLSIKNSTSAAQAMGISLLKYRLMAFLLASFTSLLAGLLYMIRFTISDPNTWGIDLSLNVLAVVVIGGMKNIWGVLIGTFIIFGLKDIVLSRIPFFVRYSNAYLMFTGALIILVVMFYPGGVIRLFKDLKGLVTKLVNFVITKWKESRYGEDA